MQAVVDVVLPVFGLIFTGLLAGRFGVLGQDSTGATLVAFYQSDRDPAVRKEALRGLFIQGNAHALVQLARAEKDPEMRREIMNQLSLLGGNKEAMDYMMEILNK